MVVLLAGIGATHFVLSTSDTAHPGGETGPPPVFEWLVSRHDSGENERRCVSILYR